ALRVRTPSSRCLRAEAASNLMADSLTSSTTVRIIKLSTNGRTISAGNPESQSKLPLRARRKEGPMHPNKALWEKGDFTRIAWTMRDSGEALVKDLSITTGLEVLDLGCGDGTTELPAAALGAVVLGVD